ncbi:MAG: hypothetical protein RL766_1375 [Bacteroidota bacterium]
MLSRMQQLLAYRSIPWTLIVSLHFIAGFFHPCLAVGQTEKKDTVVLMEDIVILASRKSEALMASATSTQLAGNKQFRNSAAPSFFDALSNLRGVQMITPSMGFRIINARGFNNTTNVRFVQTVDGLDVQSPHIGSPIGNALGPADLDIEKVELLPGVAASLYGMNAVNGLADFATRDPFAGKGLSFQQKVAVTHLNSTDVGTNLYRETAVRYAKPLSKNWAFKVNFTYMQGHDWVANDTRDLSPLINASTGLLGIDNPATDPVNGYGNESANRRTLSLGGKSYAVSRTGYYEKEVADYDLRNLKGDAMLKWKNNRGTEVAYIFRAAKMDNVYQRANRFRLENYWLQQHAIQVRMRDIKINVYYNGENTGDSYNLRSMAENLERTTLSDSEWFTAYANAYQNANTGSLAPAELHRLARLAADKNRPVPGTDAFTNSLKKLQQINNWDSGAALKVQAAFIQADLQWDVTEKLLASFRKKTGFELLSGLDFRQYITNPDGNYFINPEPGKAGRPLLYKKAGAFLSLNRFFLQKTLKVGLALRADKNDYFRAYFSPRLTTVWRPSPHTTLRANIQIGYRFPIIFEAFSNVNSGGVKRVGGLPVMSSGIFENGWLQTSIATFQAAVLRDVNAGGVTLADAIMKNKSQLKRNPYTYLQPEKVRSLEVGFRQQLMQGRLMIDADAYLNRYNAFIAQVNITVPQSGSADSAAFYLYERSKQKPYRMWTNSTSIVQNYGYSLGVNFTQPGSVMFNGQVSFTKLSKKEGQDGLEDGFNTPAWSSSFSFSTNELLNQWKLGATWRWQDSYEWISFLVSGRVPAYQTIDAFASFDFKKKPFVVKLGGTNILNQYYQSFLGGPAVGAFYYLSLTFGHK